METTKKIPVNTKEREKGIIAYKSKKNQQKTKKDRKRTKELQDRQKPINKLTIVYPSLSIITLNGNGLNLSMKRNREAE